MSRHDLVKALTEENYGSVNLLFLFDENVLIRPTRSKKNEVGFVEYPEIVKTFMLDGGELAPLAEIFGLNTYPLEIKGKEKNFRQDLKFTDFHLVTQNLSIQDEDIEALYALEKEPSLRLVIFYKDGRTRAVSYKGRYSIHWETTPDGGVMEGES